jgi:hypothetical protein
MGDIILSFFSSADLLGRLAGHALFLELFFKLLDLALEVVLFAHLLLDGAHLLVEIVLALGLFHLALDPALDALLDLEDLDLGPHQLIELFQPRLGSMVSKRRCLSSSLSGRCPTTVSASWPGSRDETLHLLGDLFLQLGELLKGGVHRADQGLGLQVGILHVLHGVQFHQEQVLTSR